MQNRRLKGSKECWPALSLWTFRQKFSLVLVFSVSSLQNMFGFFFYFELNTDPGFASTPSASQTRQKTWRNHENNNFFSKRSVRQHAELQLLVAFQRLKTGHRLGAGVGSTVDLISAAGQDGVPAGSPRARAAMLRCRCFTCHKRRACGGRRHRCWCVNGSSCTCHRGSENK